MAGKQDGDSAWKQSDYVPVGQLGGIGDWALRLSPHCANISRRKLAEMRHGLRLRCG